MITTKNIIWRAALPISIPRHCIRCFRNSYLKFFYKEKASEYFSNQEFPATSQKKFFEKLH
jgi:hypothetical protein